jgi:hypothetical protein
LVDSEKVTPSEEEEEEEDELVDAEKVTTPSAGVVVDSEKVTP